MRMEKKRGRCVTGVRYMKKRMKIPNYEWGPYGMYEVLKQIKNQTSTKKNKQMNPKKKI